MAPRVTDQETAMLTDRPKRAVDLPRRDAQLAGAERRAAQQSPGSSGPPFGT
eukprot:CAMPEP_0173392492 /NCGR_PEP_ID=MMETSP1356-20130122/19870_1 /TAXON_ID=77927 ORGANISM="Hemiselmis virescens, Strain PCC157" /NCGR_SAMPLE_ID=MMETSP1356 /ASSEMBLY_ACC=CAM_ASM_000847 /LENGTH=51 /DNA_ID=CAMNT_0014350303 /DNA_START=544 /DNA_END=695 /DNA_ORIENTATION=-